MTQRSIETLERRIFAGRGARLLAVTTVTALAFAGLSAVPAAYAVGETGTVSGTVVLGGNANPAGASIVLYSNFANRTRVGDAPVIGGEYTIPNVPVGNYAAMVEALTNPDEYAYEVWGEQHGAFPIVPGVVTVTAGGTFDADFDFLWSIRSQKNPSMANTTAVGATLEYTPQQWATNGVVDEFQWLKNEEAIPGATGTSLLVAEDYVGTTLRMVQTASKGPNHYPYENNYNSAYVTGEDFVTGGSGEIPGVVAVGDTISPTITKEWTPKATSYTYEWWAYNDDSSEVISTSKSLTVPASALGKKLLVYITARKSGFLPWTVQSAEVTVGPKVVVPKLVAANPTVVGTVKQGATLTAKPGAWNTTGVTTSYQWFEERSGKESAIAGATNSAYKIPAAKAGAKLSVRVSGKKTGFQSLTVKSSVTKAVPYLKLTLSKAPRLSGKFKVGKTVKVTIGKFSQKGVQVSYVWKVNGKKFAETAKPSLKLTKALKGKKITVTSYGKKVGYTEVSKTSKKSKKVK